MNKMLLAIVLSRVCFLAVLITLLLGAVYAHCAQAVPSGFDQYDVIIARQPFGVPPAAQTQEANAQAQEQGPANESFIKQIQIAAITEDELGVRVGLVNLKTQQAVFLSVGESTDEGVALIDAKYDEGGALLRCGDEAYWIYLDGRVVAVINTEGGEGASGDTVVSVTGTGGSGSVAADTPDGVRSSVPAAGGRVSDGQNQSADRPLSYMDRWKQRREATARVEQQRIEEAAKQRMEEASRDNLLRQYNLELIRAGGAKGTPLPIQLTPEEDAMLVREGVLPPVGQ